MNFIEIIFLNSLPISQAVQWVSITKINRLMLFRKIIIVYSENNMTYVNTLWVKC